MARLWLLAFAMTVLGQTPKTFCDPDLIRQTNPNDVDRYMDRGGRCEGLYAEQVSLSGNLLVASLTEGPVTPGAWSGQPLTMQIQRARRCSFSGVSSPAETFLPFGRHTARHRHFLELGHRIDRQVREASKFRPCSLDLSAGGGPRSTSLPSGPEYLCQPTWPN